MQYRYVYCIVCHEKDEEDEGKKYLPKFFLPPNEGVNDALKIARRGDYTKIPPWKTSLVLLHHSSNEASK